MNALFVHVQVMSCLGCVLYVLCQSGLCPCLGYVCVLVMSVSGFCPVRAVSVRVMSCLGCVCPGCVLSGLCLSGLCRSTHFCNDMHFIFEIIFFPLSVLNNSSHPVAKYLITALELTKWSNKNAVCWQYPTIYSPLPSWSIP